MANILTNHRLETKPFEILNKRWDPATALTSAYFGAGADVIRNQVGMFTKPYEEYKKAQERNASRQIDATDDYSMTLTTSTTASTKTPRPKKGIDRETVRRMTLASAKSAGQIGTDITHGSLVAIPLAFAEGMHALPRTLYGEEAKDYGKVTGWKSGMVKGGKVLGMGLVDGIADIVVQPYKGAKEEGAKGVVKGLLKAPVGLVSKVSGGMFGFWAYPAQGISRSISRAIYSRVPAEIEAAKHKEGQWLVSEGLGRGIDITTVTVALSVLKGQA